MGHTPKKAKQILLDNTALSTGRVDGVGRYTQSLTEAFIERYGDEYNFCSIGFIDDKRKAKQTIWLPRIVFNQIFKFFKLDLRSRKKLGFYPAFVTFPLRAARSAVVIHDLAYLDRPNEVSPRNQQYLERFVPRSLAKAQHIIAVSDFTKKRLVEEYRLSDKPITVVPCGVDKIFLGHTAQKSLDTARKQYNLPSSFILCLGSIEPRKNLAGSLDSYELLDESLREKYPLVIAGGGGWLNSSLMSRVQKMRSQGYNIHTPGYIKDQHLPALYKLASLLLWPSHYEGFGLPIIEAQACGTPVITSNRPPMSNIAGAGAILVSPDNAQKIKKAIEEVLSSKQRVAELINLGHQNASNYSWQDSAQKLKLIFDSLADD